MSDPFAASPSPVPTPLDSVGEAKPMRRQGQLLDLGQGVFDRQSPDLSSGEVVSSELNPENIVLEVGKTAVPAVGAARAGQAASAIAKVIGLGKRATQGAGLAGAAAGGSAVRKLSSELGTESFVEGISEQTAATPLFDMLDFITGTQVASKVARAAIGDALTKDREQLLRFARNMGEEVLPEREFQKVLSSGKITREAKAAMDLAATRLEKAGPDKVVAGSLGVGRGDTLRTSAMRESFKRHSGRIANIVQESTAKNIGEFLELNEAAIKTIQKESGEAAARLDDIIEQSLPAGFRDSETVTKLVPTNKEVVTEGGVKTLGSAKEVTEKVKKNVPQDLPGLVTERQVLQILGQKNNGLIKRLNRLKKQQGSNSKEAAEAIEDRLKELTDRFEESDGILLPSELQDLNVVLNDNRRTIEKEFTQSKLGNAARGEHVISEESFAYKEIQEALRLAQLKAFNRKNKAGKSFRDLNPEDTKIVLDRDGELSARYTARNAISALEDEIESGFVTVGGRRLVPSQGTSPSIPESRAGLINRGLQKAFPDDPALAPGRVAFRRATELPETTLEQARNAVDLSQKGIPDTGAASRKAQALEFFGTDVAAAGSAAAREGTIQLVGPEEATASEPSPSTINGPPVSDIFGPGDFVSANQQGASEPSAEAVVDQIFPPNIEGPGDFIPPPVEPAALPEPSLEQDLPRSAKEFFNSVSPDQLPGALRDQFIELISNNPSDTEKRQFIANIATSNPALLEPSAVPGFRSVVDGVVMDPAEQELYRAEVINKIASPAKRIKAKSQFNKDFKVVGRIKRVKRFPEAVKTSSTASVGSGRSSDSAEDRLTESAEIQD
jgi:hypothetical protein